MDIKVKLEPADTEENTNWIKEEGEILIESEAQWLPTKVEDEENEYYQEFAVEYNQDVLPQSLIKNECVYEQYSIEFLDEGEYYDDDYENDDYEENEDDTNLINVADDENTQEYGTKTQPEELGTPDISVKNRQGQLNRWITENYINRECIECKELFSNYNEWRRHTQSNHKESLNKSDSNYNFSGDFYGVCKECNREIGTQFSRYVHSMTHSEDAAKLEANILCKACHFKSAKSVIVQKHITEEHPEVVEEFTNSCSLTKVNCPLCPHTCDKYNNLWYHFMDKHPREYNAKFQYNCHLCQREPFNDEELWLQHLIEEHELNSWKILNYRKPFEDKNYIVCTKCNGLLFENDTKEKLFKHFIKHETNSFWSCKFCRKKINFKKMPVSHMCIKMVKYYENSYNNTIQMDTVSKEPRSSVCKVSNLKEFEEYIAHICPFCNKEFGKMLKWKHHLRTVHQIDTLRGLQMKAIADDSNKLSCVICHTKVTNSPEQLHAHRFQHLPYKPYRCLRCSVTLNTFKIAVNHILKTCKDEEDRDYIKSVFVRDTKSMLELQCSLCNYQKFYCIKTVLKHCEDEHNNFEEFFFKHPDNSILCKICQKQFLQFENNFFFDHLQLHLDEKTFKCIKCLRSYPSFKGWCQHLIKVHSVKLLLNQNSNEKKTNEISHSLNKEDNKVADVTKLPQLGKPSIKSHVLNEFAEFITYACPECNEGMTSQQNWHTHIITQHNFFEESNIYVKATDGSLKCTTCNMTLVTSKTQQQKHKLTHMPFRSFICNLCYTRSHSLGVLYQHFRRKHFAQGTFKCPVCSEVLQTEYQRTEHLKYTHPRKEWPIYMCLICYKVLSSKSALSGHMVIHDADRFRHTCNVCGSKLIELRDLNIHMARHQSRGEIKQENMLDDITSQSGSNCSQSNDTEVEQNKNSEKYDHGSGSEIEQLNKRKLKNTTLLTQKKKKSNTE